MTDTPLYCPCGNRLGLRRSDGAFVSRHVGRTYVLHFAFGSEREHDYDITCEACARTTDYERLLDKPPGKG